MSTDIDLKELESARYEATHKLTAAIIDVIGQLSPYPTHSQACDIFNEWCDEEDGEIALTRLVNLIIY